MTGPVDHLRIFLSFTIDDGKEHAQRVAQWLRSSLACGLYIFTERPAGEDYPPIIEQALSDCDVLLFLMTPGSVSYAKPWCHREVMQAEQRGRKIIPLRMVEGVKPPTFVATLTYLDLASDVSAWDKLIAQLRGYGSPATLEQALASEKILWLRQKPSDPLARARFEQLIEDPLDAEINQQRQRLADSGDPSRESALAVERDRPTVVPTAVGAAVRFVSKPPAYPPVEFQDRHVERQLVRECLDDVAARLVVLSGPPGIGKTAMLSRLAADLQARESRTVHWFGYLPTFGQAEVTPGAILAALARVADDGEASGRHQDLLRVGDQTWRQVLDVILTGIGSDRVVLAIDNVERLLDAEQYIGEPELKHLIVALTERSDHHVVLLLMTSTPIELPTGRGVTRNIVVGRLNPPDGVAFLRAMDPDGLMGIREAREADLRRICQLTDVHPRALEAVAALLFTDPGTSVTDVLNVLELDMPAETDAATFLVSRVLRAVNPLDSRVLAALAVFGQPVPPVAVDILLGPYLSGIRSEPTLDRLVRRRIVRRDGNRFYLPATSDADIILAGIDRGDPHGGNPEVPEWTRINLALRAADYFVTVAKPLPERIEDLAPRFSEVEQRIRGADYKGAVVAIKNLMQRWLRPWGQGHLALPWLRQLRGHFPQRPGFEVAVLSMMVNSHLQVGEYAEAVDAVDTALRSLGKVPDKQATQLLIQAGTAMYEHGQVTAARAQYAQALTAAERSAMPDRAAKAHSGLLLCYTETGEFDVALRHLAAAHNLMDQNPGHDVPSLRGQLHLNEAWLRGFQGSRQAARDCLKRARRAARAAADDGLLAWTYCAEATVFIDEGNYRDALDCAEQAIDRAGDRNDIRLLREAKNRCTLAHLFLDRPDLALSDATFAASIVQRHGALASFTLKGIAALRCGQDEAARSTFDRAYRLATDYVAIEGNSFEVWDLIGLVTCAIGLNDRRSYEQRMVDAFQRARGITAARGAVDRVLLLLDQLSRVTTSSLVHVAQTAATGGARF